MTTLANLRVQKRIRQERKAKGYCYVCGRYKTYKKRSYCSYCLYRKKKSKNKYKKYRKIKLKHQKNATVSI